MHRRGLGKFVAFVFHSCLIREYQSGGETVQCSFSHEWDTNEARIHTKHRQAADDRHQSLTKAEFVEGGTVGRPPRKR